MLYLEGDQELELLIVDWLHWSGLTWFRHGLFHHKFYILASNPEESLWEPQQLYFNQRLPCQSL